MEMRPLDRLVWLITELLQKMFSTVLISLSLIFIFHTEGTLGLRNRNHVKALLHRSRNVLKRTSQDITLAEFGLELHNFLREDHNTPPLKLNAELEGIAQKIADSIVTDPDFQGVDKYGRSEQSYGKNIVNISDSWISERPKLALMWAVLSWYDGFEEYDYRKPTASPFTRLIWKASTDLGIAIATKGNNTAVVATYAPPSEEIVTPSNIQLFEDNVLPERDSKKNPDSSLDH